MLESYTKVSWWENLKNHKENTCTVLYVSTEKKPAYKWTHTIQTCVVQGPAVIKAFLISKIFKSRREVTKLEPQKKTDANIPLRTTF